jgi:acetyltransferase-like isoleucine patch superfamily enzyme
MLFVSIKEKIIKLIMTILKIDEMESIFIRRFYEKEYGVKVGMYSYGCFKVKDIGRNITIGRYVSIASGVKVFRKNHSIDFPMQHPYAYNDKYKHHLKIKNKSIERNNELIIEDDVWIGANAIITPSVEKIGRGSVIGAGAVVTKNVEKYSIIAGNPAKKIRYRFEKKHIENIESSKWWELDPEEAIEKINAL